jgi:hypothetical protein
VRAGGDAALAYGAVRGYQAWRAARTTIYIGKLADLQDVPPEQTLKPDLPDLGSPKANYYQNMSRLRLKLREGFQIIDKSKFRLDSDPDPNAYNPDRTIRQSFLGERNLLRNRGLKMNAVTGKWE